MNNGVIILIKNKYLKLIFFILFLNVVFFTSSVKVQAKSVYMDDINLQKKIVTLKAGQETSIWNRLDDGNTVEGKYYSKDTKVATVDESGKIKAKMVGVTSIVYENRNNKKMETTIIVYRKMLKPLTKIEEPRYILDNDGIYRNSKSSKEENSNKARIMLVGDLMNQTRQQEAALTEDGTYNFNNSFSLVKDIFSNADYVVGNLESILSNSSPYMSEQYFEGGRPHCNGPVTYLDALKYAGFDTLVNANNHMTDGGERGLIETNNALDKYKFSHTGCFTSEDEQRYVITEINGIKVAVLSYSEKFNGKDTVLPEDRREIMLNRYSKEKVEKDIKDARDNGAEFVIVYNHWGREFWNDYTKKQALHAQEIADAGADLIVGSHPHALQTSDKLINKEGKSVIVMYSMGNFISHQVSTVTKDTFILNVVLTKNDNGEVVISDIGYIPCHVLKEYNGDSYVVTPISSEFNKGIDMDSPYFYELSNSYSRIANIINDTIPEITSYDQITN
ncbi:MAG: CapA family protein [Intestinibacter sp.]